ncbi:MAG: hypothetical protein ACT4QG_05665 [Sporichthyaceae bacterium]
MTTVDRPRRPIGPRLPAVGSPVVVSIGPYRHRGIVLEHRRGRAWVEVHIEGAEEPRHALLAPSELEPAG